MNTGKGNYIGKYKSQYYCIIETNLRLFRPGCYMFKMLIVISKVTTKKIKKHRTGKKRIKMIHSKKIN